MEGEVKQRKVDRSDVTEEELADAIHARIDGMTLYQLRVLLSFMETLFDD